jgi:hypothetical protein
MKVVYRDGCMGDGQMGLRKYERWAWRQCCGSGMFIPYSGSGSLLFTHPGCRIQGSKRHRIPNPGSGSATLLGGFGDCMAEATNALNFVLYCSEI